MKQDLLKFMFIGAGTLFVIFGFLLVRERFNDPETVFYSMLKNNISTPGVTRTVVQQSNGQSLTQTIQAQTGEHNIVTGQTELSQGSGDTRTAITTESIGTPNQDFIRYSTIETTQRGSSGAPLDFSKVVGVWGVSSPDESVERGGELFSEATLGIVPFGMLHPEARDELIREIKEKDVYGIRFGQTERKIIEGRPTYVYQASIQPDLYVSMLKRFGSYIRTSQLDTLNPDNFKGSPVIRIDFEVDVWSRQLKRALFQDSTREEIYSSYGLTRDVQLPQRTVSVQELQQMLQSVQ